MENLSSLVVGIVLAPVGHPAACSPIILHQSSGNEHHEHKFTGEQESLGLESLANVGLGLTLPAKRKRSKRASISEDQLDSLHPGNIRHRSVLSMMQPALSAYSRWLQQRPGTLPWHDGPLSLLETHKEDVSIRPGPIHLGEMCHSEPPSSPSFQEGAGEENKDDVRLPQQKAPGGVYDWTALYGYRHSLRPKICIPTILRRDAEGQCDDLSLATSAAHDRTTEHLSFNLFGSIVANSSDQEVLATTHDEIVVALPARSRFLMSHGVGTLGPLLQVKTTVYISKEPPPRRYNQFASDSPCLTPINLIHHLSTTPCRRRALAIP